MTTTEYRDGTVAELEPGDGFSYKGLGDKKWQSGPSHEYLGDRRCLHVQYRPNGTASQVMPEYHVRIWPAYFKDKEPLGPVKRIRSFVQRTTATENRNNDGLSGYAEATQDILNFIDNLDESADQAASIVAEFDLEAFRVKVEGLKEAEITATGDLVYKKVLDLLPPKPQPSAEDEIVEFLRVHRLLEDSQRVANIDEFRHSIARDILRIVETHQSDEGDS